MRRSGSINIEKDTNKKLLHSGLELDIEQHIALFNGQAIELSNREWSILTALLTYPNKIFSKNDLEDKLYDFDSDVSSNTVEVYIHHLRAKLGKDFIRTIRGLGYRLG
jgi:two-component system response regulator QseB